MRCQLKSHLSMIVNIFMGKLLREHFCVNIIIEVIYLQVLAAVFAMQNNLSWICFMID